MPAANALMFVAVVGFVLAFGSSSALSAAYGAAVIGTMFITTRARRRRGAHGVELVDAAHRGRVRRVLGSGRRLHPRQCNEDRQRRLGAARARGVDVRRLHHLARRTREATPRAARTRRAVDGVARVVGGGHASTGHGRVSREPCGLRADGAAAQPRAQSRLPRAHRDPASRDPANATPGSHRARLDRRAHARRACRARALRLHGNARRHRGATRRAPKGPAARRRELHVFPGLASRARDGRAADSPGSSRRLSRTCNGAARKPRSSSACRRNA